MIKKELSRKDKEALYIQKMTKLQTHWKNPVVDDWDFSDWTDKELDQGLEDTIGQLNFEMFFARIGFVIKMAVFAIIVFGIAGLLKFGIQQLF